MNGNLRSADLRGRDLSGANLRARDLSRANLTEADLTGAELKRANLSGANLRGARLVDAYLEMANLTGANLEGADLERANLEMANLTGANLQETNLDGANLIGAILTGASLIRAILTEAELVDINLMEANLSGAILTASELRGANLTEAHLIDADLMYANLTGADLTGADLTGANLTEANLTGAVLTGAELTGANITDVDLTDVDLTGVDLTHVIGFRPRTPEGLPPTELPGRPRIDPFQVHRASTKINYAKLIAFLKEKLDINIPVNINYPSYINETISNLINNSNETPEKKREQQEGLERLMNDRLNGFRYGEVSQNVRNSIYYVLEYVKRQPSDFQKIYIDNWLESCITDAYAGGELSCVVGVIERFIFALSNACIFSLSSGENAEYNIINSIIRQNPNVLIPEYIQDWYKLHKKGSQNAFPPETTAAEKKENLRNYLLERLPDSTELIDAKIVEIADNIGYEEDDFLYGGRRRRKNRKTTKKIKRKSNKKRQTKRKNTKRRKRMRHAP